MVLAAGLGRRLRPVSGGAPKALVEVGSKPLLAILLAKLAAGRVGRVVVNVHHGANRIEEFLAGALYPEGWIALSIEKVIRGTGGGVRNAAPLLGQEEAVLVHNVDVVSDLPLRRLVESHRARQAAATLAVQDRPTGRALSVDGEGNLCGRWGEGPVRRPSGALRPLAFSGISLLAPGLASALPGEGPFSLVDSFLDLAAREESVRVFPMDRWYWADVGTPERLRRLERDLAEKRLLLESLSA